MMKKEWKCDLCGDKYSNRNEAFIVESTSEYEVCSHCVNAVYAAVEAQ